jgi:thioredoxin-related protein
MKTDKIAVMLNKNQERNNLHWKITNNVLMFEHNGCWYDESFLDAMFPKYELCKYLSKGENKDGKSLA